MKFSYNSKSFTLFHDDNYVEIEECKNLNGYEKIETNEYIRTKVTLVNKDRRGNIVPFVSSQLDKLDKSIFKNGYKTMVLLGDCYNYQCLFIKDKLEWFKGYNTGKINVIMQIKKIKHSNTYCLNKVINNEERVYEINNNGEFPLYPSVCIENRGATYIEITNAKTNKKLKINLENNDEFEIDFKKQILHNKWVGDINRTVTGEYFNVPVGINAIKFKTDGRVNICIAYNKLYNLVKEVV